MLIALMILSCVALILAVAVIWRTRMTRPRSGAGDVIYLGYDDQDNVNSMRSTMLDRLKRGDLDTN